MKPLRILSLFDGMSCLRLALQKLDMPVEKYFASEIDEAAIRVTQSNFPDTVQVGDVTKLEAFDFHDIDLIAAGSPCQVFSFAGKQLAFDDPRSALFFDFIRLVREVKPRYFFLENVKMAAEHEQVITDLLGVEPRRTNSALVSAQNRNRLYWTNIPFRGDLSDRGITWGDIREHGVTERGMYYTEKGLEWLARHGQGKNKVLRVHGPDDKMQMIEASHHKKYSSQRFFGIVDRPPFTPSFRPFSAVIPDLEPGEAYRYITPLECERCQTVPDNYTACVSNTQRYRMCGNGWTVDVIAEYLKGLRE